MDEDKVAMEGWNPVANVKRKPQDPRSKFYHKYNPFSRIFFCWVEPLFWRGFRHTLQMGDLYACPSEADTQYLLEKFKRHWKSELVRNGKPSLSRALLKTIWWRLIISNLGMASQVPLLLLLALCLGIVTDYFDCPSLCSVEYAYLAAFGVFATSMCVVIGIIAGAYTGYKLGMLARIVFSSAIYEKILSLSQKTISNLTVGHIVNLASNDVHRFDLAFIFVSFIYIGPIFAILATVVLYYEIGWVAFIGLAMVFLQIPIQAVLAKLQTRFRLQAAKVTDVRVKVMNEVITGIRVIKMYGWEDAFHKMVAKIRHTEMMIILKSSIIRAINLATYSTTLPTMTFIIFSVYAGLGNCVTLRTVFVSLVILTMIRNTSNFVFITGITQISETIVAIKRIQTFLLLEDFEQNPTHAIESTDGSSSDEKRGDDCFPHVSVDKLSASWSGDRDNLTLKNISFVVNQECPLIAVIGSVGAGKSTLLQCLLNELLPITGNINMKGTVAYAAQEPWVFSDTFRENILFGQPYFSEWYDAVVDMCALERDIELLPDGDLTVVGERGVTLSGGQKARVGLARAVYRRAGIYLLDDPLSAVDAAVSRHIFDRCIRGYLTNSAVVVLVTHQLQYVQQCDTVLVLREGRVTMCGDTSDVLEGSTDAIELLQEKQENEFAVRKFTLAEADIKKTLAANELRLSPLKGLEEVIEEHDFGPIASALDAVSEISFHTPNPSILDRQISTQINHTDKKELSNEDRSEGNISYRTYHNYFKAGGGSIYTFGMFAIFLLAEVAVVISDAWLANWADDSDTCGMDDGFCEITWFQSNNMSAITSCNTTINVNVFIGTYGALLVAVWVLSVARSVLFYVILLRAATVLHNKMFISVLRSPVLFFDTNSVGRVLNRFSKDVGFLDDILIYLFCEFLQFFTRFLAIVFTAAVAVYYLIPIIILLVIFFVIFRWYFLKTVREIKRLESLARSPLYSHISMTLHGLPTIRAYGKQQDLLEKFFEYQNQHTQTWFMYIVTVRWFGLRIDAICVLFIGLVAFVCIALVDVFDAGLIGLALTYTSSLTGLFQYCVRESAEVESLMVSAERVLEYGKLPPELEQDIVRPPNDWPDKGHIQITDLCYKHSTNGPTVLRNINCTIQPGEKVGIVGRTGAGKSSLIAAFFRLAQPSGSIKIDGVDCFAIKLHDLRPTISIIPQDPVLFSGSVRYNLDPFDQYDSERIWNSLKQVQLNNVVESLEGGLDAKVSEGGQNFSVGQRQLFCLARALLKDNKILMLDEATANVDLETDSIIQQVIRTHFNHCTVLTVAHRLNTVMDSDKMMVLKNGELLEYGEPHDLLCNPDSYLLRLVEQTGPTSAEKLKTIALNVHNEKM